MEQLRFGNPKIVLFKKNKLENLDLLQLIEWERQVVSGMLAGTLQPQSHGYSWFFFVYGVGYSSYIVFSFLYRCFSMFIQRLVSSCSCFLVLAFRRLYSTSGALPYFVLLTCTSLPQVFFYSSLFFVFLPSVGPDLIVWWESIETHSRDLWWQK